MAELPIILAGPIVRRVTPLSVSVWMALSRNALVRLSIWDRKILAGLDNAPFDELNDIPLHTGTRATARIGTNLHVAVVTITIDPLQALLPGATYSYNISLISPEIPTGQSDLKSNGLLIDRDANDTIPVGHLALGYEPGVLPAFMLPPLTLEELNLVHGSCRKAHGFGKDGLAALDTVINNAVRDNNPAIRPHQLYFTGDQIYADEIPICMLYYINKLGNDLLGVQETINAKNSHDEIISPAVTFENFPATRRQRIINENAKLTTDSLGDNVIEPDLLKAVGMNHLMSFGEFAATYLLYWSNAAWNYAFDAFGVTPRIIEPFKAEDLDKIETLLFDLSVAKIWETNDQTDMEKELCPYSVDEQNKINAEDADKKAERFKDQFETMTGRCRQEVEDVKMFLLQIPKVRRVLANVPVYMIFDDHEVADDWNGSRDWREKVYGSPLGLSMVRNAMAAYAIFQDWGNLPLSYETGVNLNMLASICNLFESISAGMTFPSATATAELENLLGLHLADESAPPVKWHYNVPCGETVVYVLDTRTRRTFPTKYGPPGLMTLDALDEQLPHDDPGGRVKIIVSPAPVLGLGAMEILIQSAVSIFQGFEADPEAWSLNPPALETFLNRIEKYGTVVLLSGDVHYGITTAMDHWTKEKPEAARFVQLVSSSLKNEKFLNAQFVTSSMVQQVLGRLFYNPLRRLGWKLGTGLTITNPPGVQFTPGQRIALRNEPVLLNGAGWAEGTTSNREPDWSWAMDLVKDTRPDDDSPNARPAKIHVAPFVPDVDPTASDVAGAYTKVLGRHVLIHENSVPRRVVWNSHIGLVKFGLNEDGKFSVFHRYLYWLNKDLPTEEPYEYTVINVPLEKNVGARPTFTEL